MRDGEAFWELGALSNEAVVGGLLRTLGSSRRLTAELVAHLGEVEERRLHLEAAYSSMFSYCVGRLGLSEDEACRRIEVARLARRFPAMFPLLATGDLSLSVAALLKPHLSSGNVAAVLAAVSGKSVQLAREALAALFPRPDVPALIRKLPEPRKQPAQDELVLSLPGTAVTRAAPLPSLLGSAPGVEARPLGNPSSAPSAQRSPVPNAGASASLTSASTTPGSAVPYAAPARVEAGGVETATTGAARIEAPTAADKRVDAADAARVGSDEARVDAAGANEARVATARAEALRVDAVGVPASTERHSYSRVPRGRTLEPIAAARYKVQFTAGADLKAKLELARDLMRHVVPDGDLATIIDQALDRLITDVMKRQFGVRSGNMPARETVRSQDDERASGSSVPRSPCATKPSVKASATSRRPARPHEATATGVPRAVRRAVVERDGLRCSWVDAEGKRCVERAGLEYDHRHPRAKGGASDLKNVRLLCRAHNLHAAELEYGRAHMERAIRHGRHGRRAPPPNPSAHG